MAMYGLIPSNIRTKIAVLFCAGFCILILTSLLFPSKSYAYAFRTIVANTNNERYSDISGNYIVWRDSRNGTEIYLYNIATQTETAITNDTDTDTYPRISGNKIVWQKYMSDSWDLFSYDITTGLTTRVTSYAGNETLPDISGDKVVWVDDRYGVVTRDIYMRNLTTGSTTRITGSASTGDVDTPTIAQNTIVWSDKRSGNWDIVKHNLITGTETRITSNALDQVFPAINENASRIIWSDYRNINGDIYSYTNNILGLVRRLTTDGGNQTTAAISGNTIVFRDDRNGNFDIYTLDLTSNTETRLNLNIRDQLEPKISGDKISVTTHNPDNSDIGLFDLKSPTTTYSIDPPAPNGTNNWYTTNPTVTLSMDEPGAISYGFTTAGLTYSNPISIPNGFIILAFKATDFAGNQETVRGRLIKVDTVKPVTTIKTYPWAAEGLTFNQIPLIRMLTSETATSYYSLGSSNGPWTTYTDLFHVRRGTNTLYYYSVDAAGNIGATSSRTIKVADNAPAAKIATRLTLSKKSVKKPAKKGKAKKAKKNKKTIFTGKLIDSDKVAVKNKRIVIKKKILKRVRKKIGKRIRIVKKYVWVKIKHVNTNKKGEYSFSLIIKKPLTIKAFFGGTKVYKPSSSKAVNLK